MSTFIRPPREVSPARISNNARGRTTAARPLALGLVVIALGLVAVALLGPLMTGVIDYRVSPTLRDQLIGLDAVSLVVVAPLAVIAAVLVVRQRVLGSALALGIGAYTSYMFIQYILGPDYVHRAGNNQRLFPVCAVLLATGWLVALGAWTAIDTETLVRWRRRERLVGRVALPLLALVAFVRYLPSLTDWMRAAPTDSGYLAGPAFAWTIAMLDLGVFLPATIFTCAGLVGGTAWAPKALYLVVGWFGLVGPAVAAMAITMYVNDDPSASAANAGIMTLLGLAFLTLAVLVFRPLLHQHGPAEAHVSSEGREF